MKKFRLTKNDIEEMKSQASIKGFSEGFEVGRESMKLYNRLNISLWKAKLKFKITMLKIRLRWRWG